jgi:hypothetical protein
MPKNLNNDSNEFNSEMNSRINAEIFYNNVLKPGQSQYPLKYKEAKTGQSKMFGHVNYANLALNGGPVDSATKETK